MTVLFRPTADDHMGGLRRGPVKAIIVHATAGTNSLDWLTHTSRPPVSCHVLVARDGTRYRLVPDQMVAWHAGYGKLPIALGTTYGTNDATLGIELENLNDGKQGYPWPQVQAMYAQVGAWFRTYGGLYIYRHGDLDSRKTDPRGLDWQKVLRGIDIRYPGMRHI